MSGLWSYRLTIEHKDAEQSQTYGHSVIDLTSRAELVVWLVNAVQDWLRKPLPYPERGEKPVLVAIPGGKG